jgi:oxygen-independent coproporphyrinogen III oxidase
MVDGVMRDRSAVAIPAYTVLFKTLCGYCGCNTRHREPVERYVRTLEQEIARVAELAGSHRVAHVHWGGGTPTIVGPDLFRSTMAMLRYRFDIESSAEIAVEVDPRRLDSTMAAALGQAGVTRASLGAQTFDPAVQKAVARVQSLGETKNCADLLRGAGIQAINVDLFTVCRMKRSGHAQPASRRPWRSARHGFRCSATPTSR